jgi:lysophospholipase L1-like esterase
MTRDHLALVAQRIIPFEPDFVILLVGINELGLQLPDDYSPIRMDRRSAVRSQHPASLRFLLQARCADWSHLARMAIWSWRRATYTGESASPIQDERGTWIAERRRLRAAMPTKPIDASGLPSPEYAQNLRSLIGIARANGCEPVLVTQPALWGAPPGDWEQLLWVTVYGADFTASPDQLWEMLESFNDVTRTVAAEEQVLVIDLARLLPKSTEFFYDDDHFTVAGSQQVADIIAEALQRELDARSTRPEPGPK